jgi:hypothetical protein
MKGRAGNVRVTYTKIKTFIENIDKLVYNKNILYLFLKRILVGIRLLLGFLRFL